MGMYSNSYAEIALGHSRKIMDKLTVGAKVKFLLGIYNADFHINDMKPVSYTHLISGFARCTAFSSMPEE